MTDLNTNSKGNKTSKENTSLVNKSNAGFKAMIALLVAGCLPGCAGMKNFKKTPSSPS